MNKLGLACVTMEHKASEVSDRCKESESCLILRLREEWKRKE